MKLFRKDEILDLITQKLDIDNGKGKKSTSVIEEEV